MNDDKLTLQEVKRAIKVDFTDDDTFINMLIVASEEYLKSATGYDLSKSYPNKAKVFCIAMINECYKDRCLSIDSAGNKMRFIMKDILIQLSYEAKHQEEK